MPTSGSLSRPKREPQYLINFAVHPLPSAQTSVRRLVANPIAISPRIVLLALFRDI